MKNKELKGYKIEIPNYIGEVEILKGFIIKLEQMPSLKHQENMKREFGWIFKELKNEKRNI